jgi:hypothetical protein
MGKTQTALLIGGSASDYIPPQDFDDILFNNVENSAMTYVWNPPQGWATVTDCGDFPCTGPKNVVFNMKNIKYEGEAQPNIASKGIDTFSIIADVPGYSKNIPTCQAEKGWNAYVCSTGGIGVLLFESKDPDKFDRAM